MLVEGGTATLRGTVSSWREREVVQRAAWSAAGIQRVAFFCTEGGSGERRAWAELQRICGKPPVATIAVKEDDLERPRHAQPLQRFVKRLAT